MEIVARDLCMEFNDAGRVIHLFRGLNLTIPSGERRAIVGASGVGKTTLLYLLGGLELPTAGDIVLGKTNITEQARRGNDIAPFRGKSIGFVFQFHQLLSEFDAVENVAMPLLIQGLSYELARSRAEELLEAVGLSSRLGHRPGMLSGGEQQRVALARALAPRPGILLADEPTGNLDSGISSEITSLLIELQTKEKITLVVVTHSPVLAARIGNVLELTSQGIVSYSGEQEEM